MLTSVTCDEQQRNMRAACQTNTAHNKYSIEHTRQRVGGFAAQPNKLQYACNDHTCPSFTRPWMHMGEVFCTVPSMPLTSTTAAASNPPE